MTDMFMTLTKLNTEMMHKEIIDLLIERVNA